jgi:hypothetical protein
MEAAHDLVETREADEILTRRDVAECLVSQQPKQPAGDLELVLILPHTSRCRAPPIFEVRVMSVQIRVTPDSRARDVTTGE